MRLGLVRAGAPKPKTTLRLMLILRLALVAYRGAGESLPGE